MHHFTSRTVAMIQRAQWLADGVTAVSFDGEGLRRRELWIQFPMRYLEGIIFWKQVENFYEVVTSRGT